MLTFASLEIVESLGEKTASTGNDKKLVTKLLGAYRINDKARLEQELDGGVPGSCHSPPLLPTRK